MNKVHFLPFVGKEFANGVCGKRVLALGESIYGNKPEDKDADATRRRIGWYVNDDVPFEHWMNTYTKFIRALSGNPGISRRQTVEYWDKMLFYTYVQEPLEGPEESPNDEAFENAKEPLMEILREYEPDVVLVWGERLGDHLPSCFEEGDNVILPDGVQVGTKVCDINGHRIHALIMYHPCYIPYSSEKWHEMIEKFLNDISPNLCCDLA